MGRGGRNKPWREDAYDYQLWRGAWSPSLRDPTQRPWRQRGDEAQQFAFPSYTSIPSQPQERAEQITADPVATGGRAQGVQTLLNPARKAEQKLQKLHATKARLASQFNAFLRGLKKSFVKEITKFQSDNAKIAPAIEEAEAEQERTFEMVRNAILGGAVDLPDNQRQPTPAENMWDQLRTTWEQEDGALLQEVMSRGRAPAPPAAAARQLSPDAQQLLAYFGAANTPFAAPPAPPAQSGSSGVSGPPPIPQQLSPDIAQLLQHFAAADGASLAGSGMPTPGEMHEPTANNLGGLDPSLFAPCAGISSGALRAGEPTPSTSISPGAKARRALATPAVPRKPLKTLTKPPAATQGQPSLAEKLERMRQTVAVKEAMSAAGLHMTGGSTGGSTAPPGLSAPTAKPKAPPSDAGVPNSLGATEAMKAFGRPVSFQPPTPGVGPAPSGEDANRRIDIREATTEDEMEDADKDQ